jgi:uncharacterized protein YcgI (DUF1989 family)
MHNGGSVVAEFVLAPVSGKALPIQRGQTLTIEQVEGNQCVDFNCFSLHDYKERMSVGMMRRRGFHAREGDYIVSAPPRGRLMMKIAEVSPSCVIDTLGSRCSAEMFESSWGFDWHTNCQDTLAEAIREFGLTPDDTHDSLNFWMDTTWEQDGSWGTRLLNASPGDRVQLLALFDVLAVPVVCGSGDISGVSNYQLNPIRVLVHEASGESLAMVDDVERRFRPLLNQRLPSSFAVPDIKATRALVRDAGYEPAYRRSPIGMVDVEVELGPSEAAVVDELVRQGRARDDADAVRIAVFEYVKDRYTKPSPFQDPVRTPLSRM